MHVKNLIHMTMPIAVVINAKVERGSSSFHVRSAIKDWSNEDGKS